MLSHSRKVWERVMEARLRKMVMIYEQQYGFIPKKNTTDTWFVFKMLMVYNKGQNGLHYESIQKTTKGGIVALY